MYVWKLTTGAAPASPALGCLSSGGYAAYGGLWRHVPGLPACLIGKCFYCFCFRLVLVPLFSCCAFLLRLNQGYTTTTTTTTTRFPTHRRPYGFRSFSSTKMSFSLQRNVIFSHVDVKNRVLKISKTTSFFDISSCFFGMQHFFSFFSEALHCFDGLAKFFEKPVRCQWSQRFSPTETFPIQGVLLC